MLPIIPPENLAMINDLAKRINSTRSTISKSHELINELRREIDGFESRLQEMHCKRDALVQGHVILCPA